VSLDRVVGVNFLPMVLFTLCDSVRFVVGKTNLTDLVFCLSDAGELSGRGVAGAVGRPKIVFDALCGLDPMAWSMEDSGRVL